MADPATYLASNSVLGTLFSSENCLFIHLSLYCYLTDIKEFEFLLQKLHGAPWMHFPCPECHNWDDVDVWAPLFFEWLYICMFHLSTLRRGTIIIMPEPRNINKSRLFHPWGSKFSGNTFSVPSPSFFIPEPHWGVVLRWKLENRRQYGR